MPRIVRGKDRMSFLEISLNWKGGHMSDPLRLECQYCGPMLEFFSNKWMKEFGEEPVGCPYCGAALIPYEPSLD